MCTGLGFAAPGPKRAGFCYGLGGWELTALIML